ncbi:MAG: cytochrome oxidase assembly protein [Anaerolineaceae bacterium]|nr:cytochrome oxidase assembly protein [Anaerolineaceae bacterium]
MNNRRISIFSGFLLIYNILVILFGAFVRATGSGAGCGAHWPLCNGDFIPRPEQVETIIEFTHRVTSGFSLVFVLILFVMVFRSLNKGNPIRKAAFFSLFFTITEALVGAGLVLFELVAGNTSGIRAYSVSIHLINTYLLLGSIVFVFVWSTFGVPLQKKDHSKLFYFLTYGLILLLLILGASGAITALGDTLFPSESFASGLALDLDPTAHFLIRLRVYHPFVAVITGVGLGLYLRYAKKKIHSRHGKLGLDLLTGFYLAQLILGGLNVVLLAPIWMQIVHLFVADSIWILFLVVLNDLLYHFNLSSLPQTEPSNP